MSEERVNVTKTITSENLKQGGFLFQFPEGTSEDDQKKFNETLNYAKEKGLNLVVAPEVRIIDTRATPKVEPVVEAPKAEPVKEVPKVEEKKVETPAPVVEQPVQAQPQVQVVQQPQALFPPMPYQVAQGQAAQYNPAAQFYYVPAQPQQVPVQAVQQPVPQPIYNPQPVYLIGQPVQQQSQAQPVPQFVYPYTGFVPPKTQEQPKTTQ